MMRHASKQGDPYDYPYRDPGYGSHRDLYDPAGYRDPPRPPRESYWDPHEPRSSHRNFVREPAPYRNPPGPRVAADVGPPEGPGMKAVGNITNSDDFASKDSRLFVGNLNTVMLSKEDVNTIFGRMGHVTGISMHKGYAFVQFSSPGEARRALALENGQTYGGQALDLNIVSQPKRGQKRIPEPPIHEGFKRMEESSVLGPAAKRPRSDGNPSMQRSNLVTLANSEHGPSLVPRQGPGAGGPWRGEPEELGCSQCSAVFQSAWSLCLHAQQRHNVTIFRTWMKNSR